METDFRSLPESMEAEELAADAEAVAVGKLLAAIEAYKADANAELLQAAIAQFKEDNKDQESDQTAKVATNGWMMVAYCSILIATIWYFLPSIVSWHVNIVSKSWLYARCRTMSTTPSSLNVNRISNSSNSTPVRDSPGKGTPGSG